VLDVLIVLMMLMAMLMAMLVLMLVLMTMMVLMVLALMLLLSSMWVCGLAEKKNVGFFFPAHKSAELCIALQWSAKASPQT